MMLATVRDKNGLSFFTSLTGKALMKNRVLTGFLTMLLFCATSCAQLHSAVMTEINSITTESMKYSDQIRLGFNDFPDLDYKVNEIDGTCSLSLYNVTYTSAVAKKLAQNIKSASRNITNVVLSKISREGSDQDGSLVTIIFANNNIHLNVQNLEHPHQLIIDVTANNLLQTRLHGTGVIAQAFNKLHAHYAAQTLV